MKKLLFLVTFLPIVLFSASSEAKILRLIFTELYDAELIIYSNEKEKLKTLAEAELKTTSQCSEATFLYSSTYIYSCKDIPLFTSSYKTLRENSNAIGAFYWRKGRPNIIFIKTRLKKFNLELPEKLKKYEVDEL